MRTQVISTIPVLSQLGTLVIAEFQNDFKNVIRGSDLSLRWDEVDATDYPLVISARLISRTSEYRANLLESNITAGLYASSFVWESVPEPLPFLETASYEIEVRPQDRFGENGSAPGLASSPYFFISEREDENTSDSKDSSDETTTLPSRPNNRPVSSGGVNNNAAIAAGILVPVVVIIAIFGFVWIQRRQKRLLEERRKQREELCID
ncbi:hypothetical protein F4779DRAFT_621013 [Xylariaceae sp. FL0662B]|nr:hypothetical protein F4779DRAFT_621013 [Xylariaceae sp. FL0662B]